MTLKESASKMKNALKLFRPHLLRAPLPEHFLVRQHGGGQGTTFKRRNIFFSLFFFFLFRENGGFTTEKMGPREMRKHRKPPENL